MREALESNIVAEWMSIEENREAYKEWRNNPVTARIMALLRKESAPLRLPVDGQGRILVELSPYFHGQNVGEHRVLRRIMSLDAITEVPQQVAATYNMEQHLIDEGYTPEDAKRIIEENLEGETEDNA